MSKSNLDNGRPYNRNTCTLRNMSLDISCGLRPAVEVNYVSKNSCTCEHDCHAGYIMGCIRGCEVKINWRLSQQNYPLIYQIFKSLICNMLG